MEEYTTNAHDIGQFLSCQDQHRARGLREERVRKSSDMAHVKLLIQRTTTTVKQSNSL